LKPDRHAAAENAAHLNHVSCGGGPCKIDRLMEPRHPVLLQISVFVFAASSGDRVSRIFANWNRIDEWLKQLDAIRKGAEHCAV
jgi:hypothetical protein